MAFIVYELNKEDAREYKGFYYKEVHNGYIIFDSNEVSRGRAFSIKGVKSIINNIIDTKE